MDCSIGNSETNLFTTNITEVTELTGNSSFGIKFTKELMILIV